VERQHGIGMLEQRVAVLPRDRILLCGHLRDQVDAAKRSGVLPRRHGDKRRLAQVPHVGHRARGNLRRHIIQGRLAG